MSGRLLRRLESLRSEFGPGRAAQKLALLRALERVRWNDARSLARWHETLLYLRALPDDARIERFARRELARFARRPDLRRVRDALADSGIAGTELRFRFFQPTAAWLAQRFPRQLTIDWDEFDGAERAEAWLGLLLGWGESAVLDGPERTLRERIAELRARGEGDAAWLTRRIDALDASPAVRRQIHEDFDPPLVLRAGRGTPSRTTAAFPVRATFHRGTPLSRARPELARALVEPPLSIRALGQAEGRALVTLAREAMVVRTRDLDAFMAADARDAVWIDCGEGLAFACLGVVPEERLLLESVHALLTLRNGVPVGYVLASSAFDSCQVAYNVFETWRGGDAAWIYGRVLASLRALFGCTSFCVDPYQLGHENEEGLASGAWWFYAKLGFRPRERGARALAQREFRRLARRPGARSSRATLERLVEAPVFWSPGPARADVIGAFPLERLGAAAARELRARGGGELARAEAACEREARARLGLRRLAGWTRTERLAWRRWAPLILALPGLERWTPAERRALVALVRAKGGRRERDYLALLAAHRPLRRALCRLARVRCAV